MMPVGARLASMATPRARDAGALCRPLETASETAHTRLEACEWRDVLLERSPFDWENSYAARTGRMRASEIRELLKVLDQPGILSFAGGIPDPRLFPTEAIRDASSEILGDPVLGPRALQYSVSEGYAPLREWIVGHMGRLGVPCDIGNVVVTSGSQQGLDYLGKLLLSAGDTALVTAPTYLGALQAFNPYEPRYDTLHPGMGNTTPAAYAEAAGVDGGGRVAFAYVVPDFANPTGETMSEPARLGLLDLVADLGVPLIEDAAYEALRFEGNRVPSCLALDTQRRGGNVDRSPVVYCGTFSKTISPGLRVGWICAARDLIQKIVLAKQAADLHSPSLNQMIMHRIAESHYDRLVPEIVGTYARRRDAMLAALERHMPPATRWTRPEGGMFIWVELPGGLNGTESLQAALQEEKVAFVPGTAFYADGSGAGAIRLSFSYQSEADITEGMARLGRLLTRRLAAAR